MKYTPATITKALVGGFVAAMGAATAAAGGADLSALDVGQWVGVLGAGLVAFAGVFAVPNKDHNPAPEAPVVPLPDVVIGGTQQAVENAAQSISDLDKIRDGVGQILGAAPVLGPLAQQAIDSIQIPRA